MPKDTERFRVYTPAIETEKATQAQLTPLFENYRKSEPQPGSVQQVPLQKTVFYSETGGTITNLFKMFMPICAGDTEGLDTPGTIVRVQNNKHFPEFYRVHQPVEFRPTVGRAVVVLMGMNKAQCIEQCAQLGGFDS
jgi:hypothetical protein